MLGTAKRLSEAATVLWRGIQGADRGEARKRVRQLRRRYPDVPRDELFKSLVYSKCAQIGAVGALSSALGVLPGVGKLGGVLLGTVADEAMVTTMQSDLVAEIFALYDVDLAPEVERVLIASIAAGHAGANVASTGVARQVAQQAQRFLGGSLSRAALPVAGIATAAAGHVAITYAIASRARAVAKLRHAGFTEWPDLLRELTMIDERKIAAWATQATRAAVTQATTAARAWMRQLGAMLPEFPKRRPAGTKGAAKRATPVKKTPATKRATPRKPRATLTSAAGRAPARRRRTTTRSPDA